LATRGHLVRVTHEPPPADFGVLGWFWGSRKGYRGQIAMFLVSKEWYFCTQVHAAKKYIFLLPQFLRLLDFLFWVLGVQ